MHSSNSSLKNVAGFLLLTLSSCTIDSPSFPPQTGTLFLQCVTLDFSQLERLQSNATLTTNGKDDATAAGSTLRNNDRDIWLVLKLNSFESVILPTERINYSRSGFTYIFLPEREGSELFRLVVPLDSNNPSSAQDLETLEVILSQYGVLHDMDAGNSRNRMILAKDYGQPPPYTQSPISSTSPAPTSKKTSNYNDQTPSSSTSTLRADRASIFDFKGHLVLMDQDNGEIMGTLDEKVKLKEDEALSLSTQGEEKDPVVIELPDEEEEATGQHLAHVRLANGADRDILMRTAGMISNGILFLSSALSSGISSITDLYIAHSTPSTSPIIFSPRTSANVKRIHSISGVAVTVTSKTTNAIYKLFEETVNRFADTNQATNGTLLHKGVSPPPLPPRKEQVQGKEKIDHLPPPLPPRSRSPSVPRSLNGYTASPSPITPPQETRLLNRVLASTDIILSALEQSATQLVESGTDAVSRGISHRYGTPAGDLSRLAGGTIRNVGLVYVDVRGVGRRALLKRAGKTVAKAKFAGRDIVFMSGADSENAKPRSRLPSH